MPLFENNLSPYLTIVEATEPAAPAAGQQRLYIDSTTHKLKATNSSGTERDIEGGAATSAAYVTAHFCRVKRASGNVSVGNNVLTVIGFDAEDFDTDTMHDNSTNPSRIVIPSISGVTTGLWTIKASGYTNATTRVDAMLRVNAAGNPASGTSIAFYPNFSNNTVNGFIITTDYVFTAADYVELFVRSTGATGQVTFDAVNSPIMTVSFLGKIT